MNAKLKTLDDFKEEYAKTAFFKTFNELCELAPNHIDIVIHRAAEEYAEYMAISYGKFLLALTRQMIQDTINGKETNFPLLTKTEQELYKIFIQNHNDTNTNI
jgi:hypothetical protein